MHPVKKGEITPQRASHCHGGSVDPGVWLAALVCRSSALSRALHAAYAMHFCFEKTSPMISAPALPERAPEALVGAVISLLAWAPCMVSSNGLAFLRAGMTALAPRATIATLRARASQAPSALDLVSGLNGWDLAEQFGQNGSIADPATGDLNRQYFQRVRINTKMHFPPMARSRSPMFLCKPLPFSLNFDPGAANQKVQSAVAPPTRDGDVQALLTTRKGAEVWLRQILVRPASTSVHQPYRLPKR